jgi:hypothetical protein
MKKYRLKINYPSLFKEHKIGDIVYYNSLTRSYIRAEAPHYSVSVYDVENFPDCWELIEEQEPLFITEDGVECFDGDEYISIGHDFCMRSMRASNCDSPYSNDVVRFKNESNADEYIWKNKPIFSYNDIKKLRSGGGGVFYDVVAIAKERSKE